MDFIGILETFGLPVMMVFALGTNLSGLTSQSGAIYKDALVLNALINGNILI